MNPDAPASPLVGVLLMAYGSPETVEEMEPYLLDIRGGRPTSPELVKEIQQRYREIGGRSPLLDLTREQALRLEEALNQRSEGKGVVFRAYVGMRHWEPRIKEGVRQMVSDGVKKGIALVMAPHASRMSTGAYYERLDEAVSELGAEIEWSRIQNWHLHPGLIQALEKQVRTAWNRFDGESPFVVFSAHSLPRRILSQGDLFDVQLQETAQALAERLGLEPGRWMFSYQSAGQSAEPWLGPAIEKVIVDLAQSGEKNILVAPIGFVCDHVEVLYDIDIAGRRLAEENGARLERAPMLNAEPLFISALADLVLAAGNSLTYETDDAHTLSGN